MKNQFVLSALLFLILALPLRAAAPAGEPAAVKPLPQERRYLFLVDVSGGTKHCRDAIAKTVHDLVASGMNGEMKPGDLFAIWPYRSKVITDQFVPQTWMPALKEDLATAAGDFIRQQNFTNTSMALVATMEALKVVQASRIATIILINDGSEYLQGTPYDAYVNQIYKDHAMELWREKKPFVTTLLGVKGNVVGCTVSTGNGVTMPPMPEALKQSLLALADSTVKAPIVPVPAVPAKTERTQPARANPLPADTGPPVAMPLPPPPATSTPAPVTPPVPAVVQAIPAAAAAPAPMPAETPLAVPPPSEVVAAAPPILAPPLPGLGSDVAPQSQPAPAAPVIAGAVPPASGFGGSQLLFLAITLVVVAALIIWIMVRGRREPKSASLITRSMRR